MAFWDVAKHYDNVVTFNGRGFDVPFIYLRSALLNVPISKKNWLGYRYATEPHCDLAEQLTFYSVSGRDGAARRFNLDFYCKAFGIDSPKSHGVTGMDVPALMAEEKFRDIAEYCLRDVRATVELYKIWKERLAGIINDEEGRRQKAAGPFSSASLSRRKPRRFGKSRRANPAFPFSSPASAAGTPRNPLANFWLARDSAGRELRLSDLRFCRRIESRFETRRRGV